MAEKAKESVQIAKARKKIEQRLEKAEKKINPEALQAMSKIINQQLSKKKSTRIDLKDFNVSFDENKHPANIESKFIIKLIRQIKHEQSSEQKDLEGRIRAIEDEA